MNKDVLLLLLLVLCGFVYCDSTWPVSSTYESVDGMQNNFQALMVTCTDWPPRHPYPSPIEALGRNV